MATINPGFQGAPVLKDEFNPVEMVQNLKSKQFETQKALYERKEAGNIDYLKNLITDVKAWEDKKGFDLLRERNNKAYDIAMQAMKKGANLNNPKTDAEVTVFKTLNDYHTETQRLADLYNSHKIMYDKMQEAIIKDHESGENKIDYDATQSKFKEILDKSSIDDMGEVLQNAIQTNPQISDVFKYINNIKGNAPKLDTYEHSERDGQGNLHNVTTDIQDPKTEQKIIKYYRDKYKYADPNTKRYIHNQGEVNKGNEPAGWEDTDRFVSMAYPNYKQRFLDKESSRGGDMQINFGGHKLKMSAGEKTDNPHEYGGKIYSGVYDFNSHPTLTVNVGAPGTMGVMSGKQKTQPMSKFLRVKQSTQK